jgi:hypothetical protein
VRFGSTVPTRALTAATAAVAGLLLAAACRQEAPPEVERGRLVRKEGRAPRSLLTLVPAECRAGEVFRRLPSGGAELIIAGRGLTRGDVVLWSGRPLRTFFASSRTLSAEVPPAFLEKPGQVEVTVEDTMDPTRPKLRAGFEVRPAP